MSEVKVNKISPRSGTTVTLGDSGDTITLASGVSLTGVNATFSGDLTVDTNTLYVDSTNNRVGIGTSSPSTPLTLDIGTNNVGLFQNSTDATSGFSLADNGGSINLATTSSGAFRVLVGGDANTSADNSSEAMRIDSSGNVGIGATTIPEILTVNKSSNGGITGLSINNNYPTASTASAGTGSGIRFGVNDGSFTSAFGDARGSEILSVTTSTNGRSRDIVFKTDSGGTLGEVMRIDSSGNVLVGRTDTNLNNDGFFVLSSGGVGIVRNGSAPVEINRKTNDGELISFRQDFTQEGTISVSGATVSYNGFTGTHWSRLSDNSKPTILKGTILESLDEMMDWYQVQFDITEADDEGNEITRTQKESYALGDGESVGDVITYTYEGTDYQAIIIQEGDVKHTKSKVSNTVDAKNVYGVFMDWDNDDDTVNDMYVAQTGTFVVRINSAETVSKGDLIQSNGDGTGKVQADDIIRSSTVAKILSTTKIETYEDGSYIVPCSLHC